MKCAIILVAVCLAAVLAIEDGKHHYEETPEQKKIREECAKEHNIDFTKLKLNPEDKSKQPEISHDFKCFAKCTGEKTGLIDANGKPDYEKVAQLFPKLNGTIIDSIKSKCTSTATDKCDNYWELKKCAIQIIKENHVCDKKE